MDVRRATADDVDVVASTFADAFSVDPLFQALCGTDRLAPSRLVGLFRAEARQAVRHDDHLLFVHEGGGAALWRAVDEWRRPWHEQIRSIPGAVAAFGVRSLRALAALGAIEAVHPHDPHYYLDSIGTMRSSQGRGIGTTLLRPVLDRIDAEGVGAYLASSNPRNLPFYARHGFAERDVVHPLGDDGPVVTTMWRAPR